MAMKDRETIQVQQERAVLAALRLPTSNYDERDPFGELAALAEQAGGLVVGTLEQRMDAPVAGTYMGTGKVSELKSLCEKVGATLVIFDHELSPRQIANIEKIIERKVVDRSELILDIFAGRATTTEAKLQVELAQLEYTYPRLRAMWTHLERIGGGGIGSRGPGEQQLEIDRRLAQARKVALQRELSIIQERKRRMVAQRNLDHFTVGIVGYTNAGKSTLFNVLTAGGAYADDRLFATLTTRTRQWDLGGGVNVMLSDTVGFVRDLPHNLVASFKATLEEATHANLLLIVLDVSDPSAELHYATVQKTLDELFKEAQHAAERAGEEFVQPRRVLLLNKVDLLKNNASVLVWQRKAPGCIAISARTPGGPGHAELADLVRAAAQGGEKVMRVTVPMADSRTVYTLETKGQVTDREYVDGDVTLTVRIGQRQIDQLLSLGARMRIAEVIEDKKTKASPVKKKTGVKKAGAKKPAKAGTKTAGKKKARRA